MTSYSTESPTVSGAAVHLLKGGSGSPLLVLHDVEGFEGWLAFHDALAESSTVYAPSHPGFGHTPCPDWVTSVSHVGLFYLWLLEQAGIAAADVVGVGLGGWVAACMAAFDPSAVRHLMLVNPAGIRPRQGEVLDIFVTPWPEVVQRCFFDAAHSAEYQRLYAGVDLNQFGGVREAAKTMAMRLCYRPYMHDPSLPGILGKVGAPTLVAWSRENQVIPSECGSFYQQCIPGARLQMLERCGQWAHLERPDELAAMVKAFIAG